jgi:hypothetical protein
MKTNTNFLKITLGVFLMTTAIAFANNNDPINKDSEKSATEVASLKSPLELNSDYVAVVHESSSRDEVRYFSTIISEYDVRESDDYNAQEKDYTVDFKSKEGFARASYDDNGRVVSVKKTFKNVMIPAEIQQHVSQEYQGFEIVKNKYMVSYNLGEDVEKTYILNLKNGKEKKKIRVNG